ncbi:hypothetical protein C6341_g23121 [Phytophthora cactorum]|nr:hypothetical protein C6341_g23121 [Phytophthora cactorum]
MDPEVAVDAAAGRMEDRDVQPELHHGAVLGQPERLRLDAASTNLIEVRRRATFSQLLGRFSQFYRIAPASSRGRSPKLRYHHQVLGLILCFYVRSIENSTLCMVFGVPPSTLSRTLRRAEKPLAKSLEDYAPARIAWPSPARQMELARLVEDREPLLKHMFGFIDGKNLRVSLDVYVHY